MLSSCALFLCFLSRSWGFICDARYSWGPWLYVGFFPVHSPSGQISCNRDLSQFFPSSATPRKVNDFGAFTTSSPIEHKCFPKRGRNAVPKVRAVMGVCGGSSYADHPTKMLMGYFVGYVDVVLGAVCEEAEDVVGGGVSRN